MAREAFDLLASQYDAEFSHTPLGKLHRERVWNILLNQKWLPKPQRILEVNCGTGEDAMEWAKRGIHVLATDLSPEMVALAEKKAGNAYPGLVFKELGFSELNKIVGGQTFDLIFSNFGGLNCVSPDEVPTIFNHFQKLLRPGGYLVVVIMPDCCFWEMLIFLLRGEWNNAFRRFQKPAIASILGASFPVYYYPPQTIIKWAKPYFRRKRLFPVGFFLPPSGRNNFFSRFPLLLHFLQICEKAVARFSLLSRFSDHYLLILEKAP